MLLVPAKRLISGGVTDTDRSLNETESEIVMFTYFGARGIVTPENNEKLE